MIKKEDKINKILFGRSLDRCMIVVMKVTKKEIVDLYFTKRR